MPEFSFELLRRWPDVEADNLFAVDAADRLILDEAAAALAASGAGEVVVIGDHYGALTLGAVALCGATEVRVHQDALSGERALAENAAALGAAGTYRSLPLGTELLAGARVVLLRLPRSLDALDEIAGHIAAQAHPDVTIYAGGMIKHLALAMNEVLSRHFAEVRPGLARQKARVLTVARPSPSSPPELVEGELVEGTAPSPPPELVEGMRRAGPNPSTSSGSAVSSGSAAGLSGPSTNSPSTSSGNGIAGWPQRQFHEDLGLWICAHGGAFAGTRVDIGTRFLLGFLGAAKPDAASAIDLGCGTGLVASSIARARPGITVIATDESAAAVASALETAEANGVSDRVRVVRDDGLSSQPDASAELILLNPPFHLGATVHPGAALRLFEDAARVLAPGGELWTVFNSHLGYRPALRRIVGPTREVGRNAKFTVTASVRP